MQAHHTGKGGFRNLSVTPQLAPGYSMPGVLIQFLRKRNTVVPPSPIPSILTNLQYHHSKKPSITWFGHSSYLIHCDGINILVDPVFSGYASPFSFSIKAFAGADVYKPVHMPAIDALLITHNHYDHLDKRTIRTLSAKIRSVITPLGVSRDIKGLLQQQQPVTELDWWQEHHINDQLKLTATPSRHFSGRGLKRNGSLWDSFVLDTGDHRIFIGSDSGYDTHFATIGDQYGKFDMALLECGQYNAAWPFIHSMPEELIAEARDLRAKCIMPVHWAKFALALHDWDEPIKRFTKAADEAGIHYTTPLIGEPIVLGEQYPKEKWWE